MSGGTLTGFSALTVTSATNWTNGTISGGGTITTDGTLTLGSTSDGNQPDLSGATLDNAGTATVANSYGHKVSTCKTEHYSTTSPVPASHT